MSVPQKFTAYQGMDAFFHAAESVINTKEHPMGEMFALKAIELIAENLPKAYTDGSDREARSNMALANSLAGYYMLCTSEHTMEHELLVCALEDEDGVLTLADLRGLGGDFLGKHDLDVVGITYGHGEELALSSHAVTHTHELLLDGEAFAHTHHHVVDKGAIEAVHGAETGKVARTGEFDFISLDGHGDIRIHLLAHLAIRAFHLHDIAIQELCLGIGRKDYR